MSSLILEVGKQLVEAVREKASKRMAVLEGGKSTGLTVEDIAEKHGVPVRDIEEQLAIGMKIEREHTDVAEVAKKISLDHLTEHPAYYTFLTKMEKEMGIS